MVLLCFMFHNKFSVHNSICEKVNTLIIILFHIFWFHVGLSVFHPLRTKPFMFNVRQLKVLNYAIGVKGFHGDD
jgi:hypothetical protein